MFLAVTSFGMPTINEEMKHLASHVVVGWTTKSADVGVILLLDRAAKSDMATIPHQQHPQWP